MLSLIYLDPAFCSILYLTLLSRDNSGNEEKLQ